MKRILITLTLVNAVLSAHAQSWTNRFDVGSDDVGWAVAVGASGHVYVTGYSWSSASSDSSDYVTLAYTSAGVPLWTNRYNGPGNGEDGATALAVDASGNVYVTGYSAGNGSAWDYATVAYTSAGAPMWTNRYNGPGNGEDGATALAVDASGNVYVTGFSVGHGSAWDYATVAYTRAGVPLWTNRYNGPGNGEGLARALAVDAGSNVVVTGHSGTIKYSPTGVTLWTNRSPYGWEEAIAVDANDNVVVTGAATIKYSPAGVPLWTNVYGGAGLAVTVHHATGNAYVTGSNGIDVQTVAYTGAGVPLWTNVSPYGWGEALAVDASGNLYVTAYSGWDDYLTLAYTSTGVPWWTNRYTGPGVSAYDQSVAVAVDASGNVFVTGASWGNSMDIVTIKYAPVPLPDYDEDGVPNDRDLCPNTPPGTVVNTNGCAIHQLVPCDGPMTGGAWKNHGQYVSSVAHQAQEFLEQGLIDARQKAAIISEAARSECGAKPSIRGISAKDHQHTRRSQRD